MLTTWGRSNASDCMSSDQQSRWVVLWASWLWRNLSLAKTELVQFEVRSRCAALAETGGFINVCAPFAGYVDSALVIATSSSPMIYCHGNLVSYRSRVPPPTTLFHPSDWHDRNRPATTGSRDYGRIGKLSVDDEGEQRLFGYGTWSIPL